MSEPVDLRFVASDVGGGTWLQWAPSFTNVRDFVDQAIAAADGRCIRRLVIAAHGADDGGFMAFDGDTTGVQVINGSYVDETVRAELERLKPHLCDEAIIELRVCNFGLGRSGSKATNALANLLGVPVTAPQDEIKALGLVGGLAVDWFTAYPDDWGKDDVSSFWIGEPEARPLGEPEARPVVAPLRPIEKAHVPTPGVTPPDPIPEPVYGAPPAAQDVAGVGSGPRWIVVGVPILAVLIVVMWLLLSGGEDPAQLADAPVDTSTEASAEGAADPAGEAGTDGDASEPAAQPDATGTAGDQPSDDEPPAAAAPREATVTQGGFGSGRASARGWYLRQLVLAITQDPTFVEFWGGTRPGSVVMFNAYGPPGSMPGLDDWNLDTAQQLEDVILANLTDGAEGPELDWDTVLSSLGADPAEVCGGRIVLDIEADQGGELPGFDGDGNLAGSGSYTGQTAGCTGDFEISLEATIEP